MIEPAAARAVHAAFVAASADDGRPARAELVRAFIAVDPVHFAWMDADNWEDQASVLGALEGALEANPDPQPALAAAIDYLALD